MKELVEREVKKLKEVFSEIRITLPENSTLFPAAKDLYDLAYSYFEDMIYFYKKGKYIEAFELSSYIWGILDSMARLGFINPKKTRKYFKVDQTTEE